MGILIFLHVVGAMMFLGNIVTAAFWKLKAERGGDLPHLHRVTRNVMLADYIFTLPGIVLLLATGHILAAQRGYPLTEWNWVSASEGLFALSGLIWLLVLLPAQRAMIRESSLSASAGSLTPSYRKASRLWDSFGTLVTIIPLVVLYLMLNKPF
ncbi:Uncharacterized membrane protein [Paenibacillus sp. UNCCL117]|uniref:DUF2269 family protein n=1 Tax=unclassified Paenibacillus TaxID=185978 RepID=UPI00088E4321|nr:MULTISPECIES: DUF2269 family protein [unclassified Paenibacillus]SDC51089.1 Uncharacterized membrane protein [Paenibacillus sp. cl123]SFW11515.1 Uncharacterized membrane protein [Paenibacillus sp. UNCCL117]